jgi:hypothetical protein
MRFADLLRGTPKPISATSKEWNLWRQMARKKKIRYWLVEEGLDYVQDIIFWPFNKLNDIRFYLLNRYIYKTHALTSLLKRGEYQEFDTRLLHAVFDELVNFVEREEAWMHIICSENKNKDFRLFRYRWFDKFFGWRSPEAGVAHLQWAAALKCDEDWFDKQHPDYGKPTSQALNAQEILVLYIWWKWERPKRPDPMDASGLGAYYEERRKIARKNGEDEHWNIFEDDSEENKEYVRQLSDTYHQMEQGFYDEDTAMLIRLVKIRQGIWT